MSVGEPQTPEGQSPVTGNSDTSPAPRRTSVRQIEANRRNALRSTGPTTLVGKQASRLNAMTHGLRAEEVIIPGQEDPEQLNAILRELCEDWEPEGHTEIHLVEQIGLAEWRLRRVRRAELGEIRRQMTSSTASDVEEEIEQAARLFPHTLPKILGKSTTGIGYLRGAVQRALSELVRKGTVSEDSCLYLERVFGKKPGNPATFLRVWFLGEMPEWLKDHLPSDGEPTPTAVHGEPNMKVAAAREDLEMTLDDLDRQERKLRKQERTDLEIAQQQQSIPKGPELERIQRYETSIKRDMYRAIDQLERLQRRRTGEPLPPTVNVKVSKDD
jgi:hypothetical protein